MKTERHTVEIIGSKEGIKIKTDMTELPIEIAERIVNEVANTFKEQNGIPDGIPKDKMQELSNNVDNLIEHASMLRHKYVFYRFATIVLSVTLILIAIMNLVRR